MDIPLFPRKMRHNDDSNEAKKICLVVEQGPDIVPLVGNMTYHTLATIIAGACGIVSCLVIFLLVAQHARHYSNPIQQRQIIRIILLVPWVSFFSFLIVWQSDAGEYLLESLDFGCAIALSAFLLLLCDYVLSQPEGFDDLFGHGAWKRGQFEGASPRWLKNIWYSVLQFIPTSIIIWLATVISLAVGTYCAESKSPHFAHIWISVLKVVVTVIAIVAVFKFYGRLKAQLQPYKVFLKFFAFKGIIGLNVLQTFLVNILYSSDVLRPSKYLSHHDIKGGLPALILACEMPFFAILIFVAFSTKPYKERMSKTSPLKAVFDALNLVDLLSAFVRGPMRLVREQSRGLARQESLSLVGNEGGMVGNGGPTAYAGAV